MNLGSKKFIFLIGLTTVLIVAGILGFLFFNIPQGQAIDNQGGLGPACFPDNDCDGLGSYDYCTYGYGFADCTSVGDCSNCGSSLEFYYNVQRQCFEINQNGYCQIKVDNSPWFFCGMCYSESAPPTQPPSCDVEAVDFDKAFYLTAPNGNTQFAITDGGHLLNTMGQGYVVSGQAGAMDFLLSLYPDNNFPIYNGNTLLAFFHSDNQDSNNYLYLKGVIHEFEINLSPPEPGSFVIKNSADMVVAYIDPIGDLYLMGCVDYNGYLF